MAAQNKKDAAYGNESITSLKGADRVRKRPGVMFGSDGIEGCEHAVFEIISNSIDEARDGYGDKIIVTRFEDGSVEVEDFGRGIPVDYNKREERYNWELVFCELFAGGKYKEGGAQYEYSLGLNGLGLCATQYASTYMDAEIHSNGTKYTLHFEKGENIGGLVKEPSSRRKTGTRIRWQPDNEVFTDTNIPVEFFRDTLKKQSVVNAGVNFIFRNQVGKSFEEEEFFYANGISDYVAELAGEKAFTGIQFWQGERVGRDREDMSDYKVKMQVALCFSNTDRIIEYYHNSSPLDHGGSPERAVKTAFVSIIDSFLKKNGKYLKNESKITFPDVEDCLILVSSSSSTKASYENQTKKAVTNKFIADAMTDFLKQQLEIYFTERPDEMTAIINQVLINKRSRDDAEKTRLNLKKKLTGSLDISNRIASLVDCRSKDVTKRELYIVEGKSALGSCQQGRNSEYQAIIAVRGKILNCMKAEYDKIFKSDIIVDIIKALGCGVEVSGKAKKELASFDISGLRWNKIVICTDADVDGFQIRTLILAMLYRLTPTLIEKGYVFIAESPLFEITTKNKTYFAYTEEEKSKITAKITANGEKFTLQRSKGLGENEPDMMWLTTMNPETRRLIKVTPSDVEKTFEIFDVLLGDNLEARKEYIAEKGRFYLDDADLS